jgi:hypothetical protein
MPDRPLSLSRHSFLGRKISRHFREFHNDRRRFLTSAAGAAGLAFWLPDGANAGQGKGKGAAPKPIAGGAMPLGIFIHHFPALPTATPLSALNEPSQITDFKGYVGLNRIRGGWTSSPVQLDRRTHRSKSMITLPKSQPADCSGRCRFTPTAFESSSIRRGR